MADYMASLDKLLGRDDRILFPGHGGPVTEPQAFISGASLAYLALCGLVIVTSGVDRAGRWLAWIGLAIALVLDIFVSGHGMVKPGQVAGLAVGFAAGGLLRLKR